MIQATIDTNGLPTGFYSPDMHGDNIPEEAITLTEAQWQECIHNPGQRKITEAADGAVSVEIYTPPEPTIDQLATSKRRDIDTARDDAFAAGLPYDIAGEPDVVQTRPEDKTNLLGIAIEARGMDAEGITDAVIEFRGLSNVNRTLTPQQAIDLTNAASAHIKAIYQRSWDRKDAIDAALEAEDREGIEAVEW